MPSTYIGAIGIGVSDLEQSTDFYTRVMGMKKLQTINLPHMNEELLGYEGRSASLVLMNFIDGSNPNYKDNPIKLVVYVPDVATVIDAIREEGLTIVQEPAVSETLGGALLAFAKDPDGYLVELIQKPPKN